MEHKKNILSEVLLELTLAIGNEQGYNAIAQNTVSLWLKRLNCTSGGIIETQEKPTLSFIIPSFLKSKGIPCELEEPIKKGSFHFSKAIIINKSYYYVYPLSNQRFFFFSRKIPLSKEQCNELFPITQFFSRSLDNALERKRRLNIEAQLDDEKRLLRTLIDHIPHAIFLKDLEQRKILANQADLQMTGFKSMEEILGKKDDEIFPKHIAESLSKDEELIIQKGQKIEDYESELINKKGEIKYVVTSKSPLKNEKGETIGLVGITRDISDYKSALERIRRLSLVASQTTNAVIITDNHGKTEWVNEGFTRLTGYSLDDIKGITPGELLQGKDSDPKVIKQMSDALRKNEGFNIEIVNYHQDGSPYWINVNCNPLKDEEGKLKGFMAIETDITERVIFREELIMAKKIAEKAQLAEKTFLANMSHEIRTPLNAIIGMTSLLKDTNLTYEQNDYIETLDYSSKFLLRLINDILDLAKMESGKMELQKQAFDIRKLFNSIYQVSVLNLKTKDVQINLEIDPKIPKTLIGDEVLLQQALNNLVSNAEKFTQKGNIQLTVNLLNILENSAIVEIIINDSGIGISKENQKHIFDKFKQVGRQTKEQTGTGLGLAITKDIVELYKGTISVESTLGIGTTFKMIIPLTVPSEEIQEKQAKASIDKKEKNGFLKALVVEDNFINQKYIIRLLERLNFKYDIAENGREAIELIFDNYYDVILMDIQMPEMNGYDATYMIRNSKNKNQNSIIIALTASSMSNQRVKAKRMGMNGYLSKPFTPQELNETFKEFNLVQ